MEVKQQLSHLNFSGGTSGSRNRGRYKDTIVMAETVPEGGQKVPRVQSRVFERLAAIGTILLVEWMF